MAVCRHDPRAPSSGAEQAGHPAHSPMSCSPELDVEDRGLREVRHTLYVHNLLHLCAAVHGRVHGLGLQAQMCMCQGGRVNTGELCPS